MSYRNNPSNVPRDGLLSAARHWLSSKFGYGTNLGNASSFKGAAEERQTLLRRKYRKRVISSFEDLQVISVWWWATLAIVGGLLYGYNVSLAAALNHISADFHLQTFQKEMVSASATLMDTSSMLFGGWIADKYGRRRITIIGAFASCFANFFSSFSSSVLELMAWRLAVGLGNGLTILLVPLYVSECVRSKHRGNIIAAFQSGVCIGTSLPYVIILSSSNWRWALRVGAIFGLLVMQLVFWVLPESVAWMVHNHALESKEPNKTELSENESLSVTSPDDDVGSKRALQRIEAELHSNHQKSFHAHGALSSAILNDKSSVHNDEELVSTGQQRKHNRHLLLLLGILLAYTNNSIDVCLFYAPQILSEAHLSTATSETIGLMLQLVSWPAMFLAFFLIAALSRRLLLLLGLGFVILGYFVSATVFSLALAESTRLIWLSLSFGVIILAYQCGPGTLFVLITPELYSQAHRGKSVSICTFFMSFFSLCINATLLSTFEVLGVDKTFLLYGVTYSMVGFIFYMYLPETKHKNLMRDPSGGFAL